MADPQDIFRARNVSKIFDLSPPLFLRLLTGGSRMLLPAVDGVSLSVEKGKTFGLVGESGCGKSTLARLAVGLMRPSGGSVQFAGKTVSAAGGGRGLGRGRLQMIFQDPFASLNPRWRVRDIIAEPMRTRRLSRAARRKEAGELLEQVGLAAADGHKYPHEFSGGQRQRISIARALASEPDFLVLDEPTSALDVSVQAQILNLMRDLQERLGLTYLFISHDLAVISHVAERVGVMYLGRIVETAEAEQLFREPRHPYTRLLMDAVPDLDRRGIERRAGPGDVANPLNRPPGCHFHPRCPYANERCRVEDPKLLEDKKGAVACHAVEEGRLPKWSGDAD